MAVKGLKSQSQESLEKVGREEKKEEIYPPELKVS